jgi:hypothetical protein
MSELDSRHTALFAKESCDAREKFDMFIFPTSEILRADPPFGGHRTSLCKSQGRSADRSAAKMHQMPIVGKAVRTRVLAHRRYDNPV